VAADTPPELTIGLPCHFGDPAGPLFGLYHAPRVPPRRDVGVVLCYPMAEEYLRIHRSFRQLALRLAAAGFPALRFDYYGCGDSSGAREEGHMRRWLRDIDTAVAEVRARGNVSSVCLVGLRLGAALAMLAATERDDVVGLVLWDPTSDGEAYLRELAAADAARPDQPRNRRAAAAPSPQELREVQGFPLPDTLRAELLGLRLVEATRRPTPRVLLVSSQTPDGTAPLRQRLEALQTNVQVLRIPSLAIWVEENKTLVPAATLQAIARWLSDTFAPNGP
jgi:pimeloyl-ACP methyl ester carboxylesterase